MQVIEKNEIRKIFEEKRGILYGHFELSSGLHSGQYFQCAKVLQYPEYAELIACELVRKIDFPVDVVIGPAMGGIIIAYEIARALGVRTIFAERKDSELCLRRGFEIKTGENVLIMEDVITTAKSAKETADLVCNTKGVVAGYGCIVDRSEGQTGLEIVSLMNIKPEVYNPDDCPFCQKELAIDKPGSRIK